MATRPEPIEPAKLEDEAQSKRFMDLAKELEAKGELDPDGGAFERLLDKATTVRRPPPKA